MKPVQYGLQIPVKKTAPQKNIKPLKPNKPLEIFKSGAEEDDSLERKKISSSRNKKAEAERQLERALEEDPNIFDYDGAYDEIQQSRANQVIFQEQQKKNRKSRYIGDLLETAKFRETEQNIIYERVLLKEREKEDHLYEGKEKFVTAAFKKELIERKKWQAEQDKKDAMQEDVTKKKDLSSFYSNILKIKTETIDDVKKKIKKIRKMNQQRRRKIHEERIRIRMETLDDKIKMHLQSLRLLLHLLL